MNLRKQTRLFVCPRCVAPYLHDRAYHHALFQCLRRERMGALVKDPQ